MKLREQLEYAAKAMGFTTAMLPPKGQERITDALHWNPLTDQADSDRMACKLRMDTRISKKYALAVAVFNGFLKQCSISHNNTDEDVCRAVREARLAVAVEIGRMK